MEDMEETQLEQKMFEPKLQLAVLIDSDNVSASYAGVIFEELEKYGFASCRRIYGNWQRNTSWNRDKLLDYSIMPVQQFEYTVGKNSTDMAMVIDAMDLLYKDGVEGFCLVTSDSDFTRLAMRLREERKFVIGMGESKAPKALTRACNKFVYLDLIGAEEDEEVTDSERTVAPENTDKKKVANKKKTPDKSGEKKKDDVQSVTSLKTIEAAIVNILNENSKQHVDLGIVGSRLADKFTDFDVRTYGYTKLSTLSDSEMKSLRISKNGHRNVLKKEVVDRKLVETTIKKLLQENGGEIENLSVIHEELKKQYPKFDIKDYGFARVSSFLRSINGLKVSSNKVSLK